MEVSPDGTAVTPRQKIEAAKRKLEAEMMPLVKAFEEETGLRVSEIGMERTYQISGWSDIVSTKVRVHSL